ncbi:MAG: signal peptidase I [Trueperaceae bacterium]
MLDRRPAERLAGSLLRTLLVLTLGLAVANFGFTTVGVDGASMTPTLQHGDRAWVPRFETWLVRLGLRSWSPGDVVYFRPPGASPQTLIERLTGGPFLIKRVVAIAGQTVELRRGRLWVDGAQVAEPYLAGGTAGVTSLAPTVVPSDHLFVLGDNRSPLASRDSRAFGPVPLDHVAGRASWVVWPPWRSDTDGQRSWNVHRL